jgi:iron complex transport system ATP-binding protein
VNGPRITTEALCVTLGGRQIIGGADLAVAPGRWLAVIGPNGAGKSTLLRAVAGLLAYRGSARIGDEEVRGLPVRTRGRTIAFAPQEPVMPPDMTTLAYVLLGRTPHLGYLGRESAHDITTAHESLACLDLTAFAGRRLGTLSGGERRRVVLARALAQQAPVLLLDEPTTALDLGHQQQLMETVSRLRAERDLTVITTLHDLSLAAQYADELLLLAAGRVIASGPPHTVLTEQLITEHFQARVRVTTGPDLRPAVHLLRPADPLHPAAVESASADREE